MSNNRGARARPGGADARPQTTAATTPPEPVPLSPAPDEEVDYWDGMALAQHAQSLKGNPAFHEMVKKVRRKAWADFRRAKPEDAASLTKARALLWVLEELEAALTGFANDARAEMLQRNRSDWT